MGGGVDAAGEAGDDHGPRLPQLGRQPAGEAAGGGGGVAGADDGDARFVEQAYVAFDDEGRRRRLDFGEERRIGALAEEQVACAEPNHRLDLPLDGGAGDQLRAAPATARGEVGDRAQSRRGGAEAGEELEIGDGADILGPDQPQAGDLVLARLSHASPHPPAAPSARTTGRCWRGASRRRAE